MYMYDMLKTFYISIFEPNSKEFFLPKSALQFRLNASFDFKVLRTLNFSNINFTFTFAIINC